MDPDLIHLGEQLTLHVGGALAAKPLLERLLGPSFEYVGNALAEMIARYGNKNVIDILRRVAVSVGAESGPTFVNPRVLRAAIEDGSFADDEVMRAYFAGIVATSFSHDGRDDRAVTFLAMLRNLTARQIRIHHLIYSLIRQCYIPLAAQSHVSAVDVSLFVPDQAVDPTLHLTDAAIRRHVAFGLAHENLIGTEYDAEATYFAPDDEMLFAGLQVTGTVTGAELFLWVHGNRNGVAMDLLREDVSLRDWLPAIPEPHGVATQFKLLQQRKAIHATRSALDACHQATIGKTGNAQLRDSLQAMKASLSALPSDIARWVSETHHASAFENLEDTQERLTSCLRRLTG